MDLQIERFVLPPLDTNTYVLLSGADCCVVDPGMGLGPLVEYVRGHGVTVSRILLTHCHGDHIAGAGQLKSIFNEASLCCPSGETDMLSDPAANLSASFGFAVTAPAADEIIEPGQSFQIGREIWNVLDTSGHTPGGVSYYCPDAAAVLTGDSLFADGIGRVDLPGGSAARLLRNIRTNLLSLPDETRVLPGHGEETTVEAERRKNPFFRDS